MASDNNTIELIAQPEGFVRFMGKTYSVTVGKGGVGIKAGEGDGVTPVGTWPLRRVYYRPDRLALPETCLPVSEIRPEDGWCDDPAHPDYNRPVKLPFDASHETMWRDDHLYDLVIELGFNDDPVEPGKGSCIFMHLMRDPETPTYGCIGFHRQDLLAIIFNCGAEAFIKIG